MANNLNLFKGTSRQDRAHADYAAVAEAVFKGHYPDVLCLFGRGIEKKPNADGTPSDRWVPTPMFERVAMPSRGHSGVGELEMNLSDNNVRYGGGNTTVRAASILLRGLAALKEMPYIVMFAAGRPKYLQEHDPSGQITEGKIMAAKLFNSLDMSVLVDPETSEYLPVPNDNPVYLVNADFGRMNLPAVVHMPFNTNSEDDIRGTLHYAMMSEQSTIRCLTVGVHVPRCEIFLRDVQNEKSDWKNLDAKFISSDHVLGSFRPMYKKAYRNLEAVPAFGNTCVDEIVGARKKVDGDYKSMQPNPLFV